MVKRRSLYRLWRKVARGPVHRQHGFVRLGQRLFAWHADGQVVKTDVLAAVERSGVVIGLFANIPYGFYSYAMYPLPFSLCLQWFVFGMIEFIICGLIAAAIYKPVEA